MNIPQLESFIFDKMAATRLPGLSIALVKDGQDIYSRGFGVADIAKSRAATATTLYGAASVTKSFVALAILQLAEKGLISLADPVSRHLPAWPLKNPLGEIRIEHLLTHTTGVTALAYIEAVLRHGNQIGGTPLPIGSPADVMTFMQGGEEWIEAAPGERWFYLNEGYVALGEIIGRLTGMPYERYVTENILKPLGMTRSFFAEDELTRDGELAGCYVLPSDGKPPRPGKYFFGPFGGDAALFTNVIDLAKYASMFLARGKGVMSESSYENMTRGRVNTPASPMPELFGGEPGSARPSEYALGLISSDFLDDKLIGHTGSLIVSTAYVGFMPKSRIGVAVLANANGYLLATLGKAALAIALGKDPSAITPIRLAARLQELTGRYQGFRGTIRATITKRGDFLQADYPGGDQPQGATLLVPEKFEDGVAHFFTYADGAKVASTFRERNGTIEWVHERYKMRRVGAA